MEAGVRDARLFAFGRAQVWAGTIRMLDLDNAAADPGARNVRANDGDDHTTARISRRTIGDQITIGSPDHRINPLVVNARQA
jgi:hypothetical protein